MGARHAMGRLWLAPKVTFPSRSTGQEGINTPPHPSTRPPLFTADLNLHTDVDICLKTQDGLDTGKKTTYTYLCMAHILEWLFGSMFARFHERVIREEKYMFYCFLGCFPPQLSPPPPLLHRKFTWESSFPPLLPSTKQGQNFQHILISK